MVSSIREGWSEFFQPQSLQIYILLDFFKHTCAQKIWNVWLSAR